MYQDNLSEILAYIEECNSSGDHSRIRTASYAMDRLAYGLGISDHNHRQAIFDGLIDYIKSKKPGTYEHGRASEKKLKADVLKLLKKFYPKFRQDLESGSVSLKRMIDNQGMGPKVLGLFEAMLPVKNPQNYLKPLEEKSDNPKWEKSRKNLKSVLLAFMRENEHKETGSEFNNFAYHIDKITKYLAKDDTIFESIEEVPKPLKELFQGIDPSNEPDLEQFTVAGIARAILLSVFDTQFEKLTRVVNQIDSEVGPQNTPSRDDVSQDKSGNEGGQEVRQDVDDWKWEVQRANSLEDVYGILNKRFPARAQDGGVKARGAIGDLLKTEVDAVKAKLQSEGRNQVEPNMEWLEDEKLDAKISYLVTQELNPVFQPPEKGVKRDGDKATKRTILKEEFPTENTKSAQYIKNLPDDTLKKVVKFLEDKPEFISKLVCIIINGYGGLESSGVSESDAIEKAMYEYEALSGNERARRCDQTANFIANGLISSPEFSQITSFSDFWEFSNGRLPSDFTYAIYDARDNKEGYQDDGTNPELRTRIIERVKNEKFADKLVEILHGSLTPEVESTTQKFRELIESLGSGGLAKVVSENPDALPLLGAGVLDGDVSEIINNSGIPQANIAEGMKMLPAMNSEQVLALVKKVKDSEAYLNIVDGSGGESGGDEQDDEVDEEVDDEVDLEQDDATQGEFSEVGDEERLSEDDIDELEVAIRGITAHEIFLKRMFKNDAKLYEYIGKYRAKNQMERAGALFLRVKGPGYVNKITDPKAKSFLMKAMIAFKKDPALLKQKIEVVYKDVVKSAMNSKQFKSAKSLDDLLKLTESILPADWGSQIILLKQLEPSVESQLDYVKKNIYSRPEKYSVGFISKLLDIINAIDEEEGSDTAQSDDGSDQSARSELMNQIGEKSADYIKAFIAKYKKEDKEMLTGVVGLLGGDDGSRKLLKSTNLSNAVIDHAIVLYNEMNASRKEAIIEKANKILALPELPSASGIDSEVQEVSKEVPEVPEKEAIPASPSNFAEIIKKCNIQRNKEKISVKDISDGKQGVLTSNKKVFNAVPRQNKNVIVCSVNVSTKPDKYPEQNTRLYLPNQLNVEGIEKYYQVVDGNGELVTGVDVVGDWNIKSMAYSKPESPDDIIRGELEVTLASKE